MSISPQSPLSSPNSSSSNIQETQKAASNLAIENASIEINLQDDPDTHKTNVWITIFMAFYDSTQTQQQTASVQKQAADMLSAFTDKAIDLVRTMKFSTLPASQENVKSPNMSIITSVNTNNTIVQAQINLQGDVNSMLQQKFSIKISDAQATAQIISQSQNQATAVLSMQAELTKTTARA
jgi:hypothetical protein